MAGGGTTAGRRKTKAPTTADPIEIAMEAATDDGEAARRFLRKQEQLVGWQIASERAGFALKVLTGATGLAAALVLGVLVWQAKNANGLLVEPFSVPPEMAARGLTGEVVASRVLDRLAALSTGTNAMRRPGSYANDWGNDINLAIPTTGVSLGELQTALKRWLGKETRIRGEVYRDGGRVVLSGRVAGKAGFVVAGEEAQLTALIDQAAVELFRQTQPYRYATWLGQTGRIEDSLRVSRELERSDPNRRERAWAYRGEAFTLYRMGDPEPAVEPGRRSVALLPSMAQGWWTLSWSERDLGHGEAALKALERGNAASRTDPDIQEWGRDNSQNKAIAAEMRGDYAAALAYARAERDPRTEANAWPGPGLGAVTYLARLHDPGAARAALAPLAAEIEARVATRPAQTRSEKFPRDNLIRTEWTLAEAVGDWPAIIASAPEAEAMPIWGITLGAKVRSNPWRQLVQARAEMGDLAGAAAMLRDAPEDCDRCVLSRAMVAAMGGDWRAADLLFARAVAMTPSFPYAHYEWGRLLLKKGDAAGALSHAREANKITPRFADAQALMGEALLAQGDAKGAAARFAEAAKLTPNWGRLHLKWGEALAKAGRGDEARAHWKTSAGLYLTTAERAELAQLQGAR